MTFDPKEQFLLSKEETEWLAVQTAHPVLHRALTHSLAMMARSGCTLEMLRGANALLDNFLSLADKPQAPVSAIPKLTTYANPSQRLSRGSTAADPDATYSPTGSSPSGPASSKA